MVDWQVTATTVYCDAVDEDVTLMVYKDGSTKCAGYKKYGESGGSKPAKKKNRNSGRKLECQGLECSRATQYRDKLFAEDAERGHR